jgi:hypothetical protein
MPGLAVRLGFADRLRGRLVSRDPAACEHCDKRDEGEQQQGCAQPGGLHLYLRN